MFLARTETRQGPDFREAIRHANEDRTYQPFPEAPALPDDPTQLTTMCEEHLKTIRDCQIEAEAQNMQIEATQALLLKCQNKLAEILAHRAAIRCEYRGKTNEISKNDPNDASGHQQSHNGSDG
jgi:hypothetical protein